MIRHIVLLELQPHTTSEAVGELVDALSALPDRVEAIQSYDVGVDLGLAEGNATVSVIAGFADADAWRTYRDHPDHRAVIDEYLRPILARRSATQVVRPETTDRPR